MPAGRHRTEPLFTDLYELNMGQAYWVEGMDRKAVFDLVYRKLPESRNYLLASGLEGVLCFLSEFRFNEEALSWIRAQTGFAESFVESLRELRFTGDVYAVPEGTPIFPNEPLLEVSAPIIEAQLVETALVNFCHFQTLALTKAARVVKAARGRMVVDFGSRRAPGSDAALAVARATYLAGGHGTSNVLAGNALGIPVFGTMAHSYIQAHESEADALRAFARLYPQTTLLVDTYDTLNGVRLVIDLKKQLGESFRVSAVRLDSGDLGTLAHEARRLLDDAGLGDVKIFASSGLDEFQIDQLLKNGAPIDGFGVGTKLAVCADAPELDMAYKLVEYAGKGRFKLSARKTVYPGRKQVFREVCDSKFKGDTIGRFDEQLPGIRLLQPVMLGGRIQNQPTLEESRSFLQKQLGLLPNDLLAIEASPQPYPVQFSAALIKDLDRLRSQMH
jgi:nicotinate phosphoribosyltransferase